MKVTNLGGQQTIVLFSLTLYTYNINDTNIRYKKLTLMLTVWDQDNKCWPAQGSAHTRLNSTELLTDHLWCSYSPPNVKRRSHFPDFTAYDKTLVAEHYCFPP